MSEKKDKTESGKKRRERLPGPQRIDGENEASSEPPVDPNGFYSNNVEEAVIRLVGGTLQNDAKKRKLTQPNNGNFDPFMNVNMYMGGSHWDILADPDPLASTDFFNQSQHNNAQQHLQPQSQRGKRQRVDGNVDPTLAQIYDSSSPGQANAIQNRHTQEAALLQQRLSHLSQVTFEGSDVSRNRSWTGDGTETGGNFTIEEIKALDDFMAEYSRSHNLDRDQLCERVWANERKKDNFWDQVTGVLPHRTRASVYKHVRRSYHVFRARGKWTFAEDQQLKELFEKKGAQWKAIGRIMHRMPEDCRDRWRNYVKCGDRRKENKWTTQEEELLTQAVNEFRQEEPHGTINWTSISDRMGGTRSRIQCRYKWRKLSKTKESI